jgi:hypothetical protein
MELSITTVAIVAMVIVAATGLTWTVTQSQSVDAWHSEFDSKKQCVNYVDEVNLDTTKDQAQEMCEEDVPHKEK